MLGISTTNLRVNGFRGLSFVKKIIAAFKARVLADSGTFEAESCLTTTVQDLVNSNLYDSASLIVTPNAVKAGKIYSLKGTDLTFTRASVANRTNSVGVLESMASGVPRIEYPSGGGCPSILLEPQRTNLIPNCNLFIGETTKTTGISDSPIVGVTSVRSTKAIAGVEYIVSTYTATITNATNYSNSLYFKYDGFDIDSSLEFNNGGDWGIAWKANIEIRSTGITVVLQQNCTANIILLPNGWYRLQVKLLTTTVTTNSGSILIKASGANGSSFLICATQLELGSFATQPIITTGAIATRILDSASSTFSGIAEGTFFIDIDKVTESISSGNPDLSITDTAFSAWCGLTTNTTANPFRITFKNIGTILIDYSNVNTSGKCAIRFGAAGIYVYYNGSLVASSLTPFNSTFTKTRMSTGSGYLVKFKCFDILGELTAGQLVALTT